MHGVQKGKFSKCNRFVKMLDILKSEVKDESIDTKEEIAFLEFQLAVHKIFIDKMLNKNCWLTKENIDKETEEMKSNLECFEIWKKQVHEQKNKKQNWEKMFMAEKTCSNLRIGCAGFFLCKNGFEF